MNPGTDFIAPITLASVSPGPAFITLKFSSCRLKLTGLIIPFGSLANPDEEEIAKALVVLLADV